MKRKYLSIFLSILLALIIIIGLLINRFFFSMNSLPEGDFLTSTTSPNSDYTINFYLCNGGATTSYAIRGELLSTDTKKTKNIYWQYNISDVSSNWVDDDTIIINGKTLNLPNDRYDFRRK